LSLRFCAPARANRDTRTRALAQAELHERNRITASIARTRDSGRSRRFIGRSPAMRAYRAAVILRISNKFRAIYLHIRSLSAPRNIQFPAFAARRGTVLVIRREFHVRGLIAVPPNIRVSRSSTRYIDMPLPSAER